MPPSSLWIINQSYSITATPSHLIYEAVTLYGRSFQNARLVIGMISRPTSPPDSQRGDSDCPESVSIALLTTSLSLSFPAATKIFQFAACACLSAHWVIPGSIPDLRLPGAYRSLPRPSQLLKPSHPLGGMNMYFITSSPQIHRANTRFHGMTTTEQML